MQKTETTEWSKWANPGTIRGVVYMGAGLAILSVPEFSTYMLGIVVGVAALFFGGTAIWEVLRVRPLSWTGVLAGVSAVVLGLLIFLSPTEVSTWFTVGLAILVAIRGAQNVYRGVRDVKLHISRTFTFVLGFLELALAFVIFALPDALASMVVFATAAIAMIGGAITFASGFNQTETHHVKAAQVGSIARTWLSERDVGDEMRETVIDNLFFEGGDSLQKQVGYWVLLVLSTAIATLGILADSTAVVIGAMLVAPLMTPILAMSAGIVNGWMGRVGRSFATIVGGVTVSVLTAWIVSAWMPHLIPEASNTQIIARIDPTLLDMMIAVAAGAAGAYATVDKRVSSSITGVAIAVALVPPLGVVGIDLQTMNYADAGGSFLLFLTNLVTIVLAASVVFVITGFAIMTKFRRNRQKMGTVYATVLLGALIIIVPLTFTSEGIIASAARQQTAQEITAEWISVTETLIVSRVEVKNDVVSLILTGEGDIPSISELDAQLSEAMGTEIRTEVQYFLSRRLTAEP